MNAFRKSRVLVVLSLVAVIALGLSVVPAEAGGNHNHHGHNFHNFGHKHFGHYWPHYQPIVKYVVKPISYPVTYYDCYGQPYVVWQTSYQTVPTTYLGY